MCRLKKEMNSGQALVEFIIVLPVLIMMFTSIVDIGNIFYKKYQLENDLDYVVDLYQNNKQADISNYSQKEKFDVFYEQANNKMEIKLNKSVNVITPGLKNIISNPYKIEVKRVIFNE